MYENKYLIKFAEEELRKAGYYDEDRHYYVKLVREHTLKLIDAYANQDLHHISAPYAVELFNKLIKYESIPPLKETVKSAEEEVNSNKHETEEEYPF